MMVPEVVVELHLYRCTITNPYSLSLLRNMAHEESRFLTDSEDVMSIPKKDFWMNLDHGYYTALKRVKSPLGW